MKHYITKYIENGKTYVESWLQINAFGKVFCFSKKKIETTNNIGEFAELLENYRVDRTDKVAYHFATSLGSYDIVFNPFGVEANK